MVSRCWVSKKTLSCQKYDWTQIIPEASMIPSSVGVIKNDFKKIINKTQFQISLPYPLWFFKNSTPSFLHVWCNLQLQNVLYHFNSLLKPPFMNCVVYHSFQEELGKIRFGCLQNISSNILGNWQFKWLENLKILLESAWP